MILPPKDLVDILVNLKECIDSQLLFDPNGDWRGEFLAQVFGASSYEFSYENERIDFKNFTISPKFENPYNPPGYFMYESYNLYFMKQIGPEIPNRFFIISFKSINDELRRQNPLTKENITSALNVEWTSKRLDFRTEEKYTEGICKDNPHIKKISITNPSNPGESYIRSLSINLNQ